MGLHGLADRSVVARIGDWEIRRHDNQHHRYFTPRGLLHLQLWHPAAEVSVLTPSRLTRDRFEIWRAGIRIAVRGWQDIVEHLDDLVLPSGAELAALHTWMIVRDEVAARREPMPMPIPIPIDVGA